MSAGRLGLLAVVLVLLSGCGSARLTDTVVMQDMAYQPSPVIVPADTAGYTITLRNPDEVPHDFSVEGLPEDTPVHLAVLPDGEAPYVLPPIPVGEYTVYCGVVGHREAGMETTLMAS